MAKQQQLTELYTPYPEATGKLTDHKPGVIRVRLIRDYGGRAHYYMDGLRWPVPPVLRHLDGVTVRSLVLALLVAVGAAVALARLLGGAK